MTNLNTEIKAIFVSAMAGLLAYFRIIAIPISVLFVFMILDYITGLAAAWVKRELSSRTGIIGIIKKVMYFALIAVGIGTDWVINYGLQAINIQFEYGYLIGLFITIWLIINELMSILENIGEINGKAYPDFLKKLLSHIKKALDDKSEENDGNK